jgi:hypothetical protein
VEAEGYCGGYIARFNYVLQGGYRQDATIGSYYNQHFDAHGSNGGYGGKAGEYFDVSFNTVRGEQEYYLIKTRPALMLRGTPDVGFHFNGNVLVHDDSGEALSFKDVDGDDLERAGKFEAVGNQYDADYSQELATGDFDGDGRTDVFTQHGYNWDVSWGGASQWDKINLSGPILGNAAIGDFNGNGRADVFYADGHTWFVSDDGVGVFHALDASGYRVPELRFGDFDGDGKTDVFTVGNHWQVSYGGVSGWQPLPHKLTGSVAGLIVADFNGDGRADVATPSYNSLLGWVWKISYGGASDWTQARLPRSSIAAIGRFDGNAGADLLLWNSGDGLEIDSGGVGTSRPHSRQDMR